jgi:hypothetical protein
MLLLELEAAGIEAVMELRLLAQKCWKRTSGPWKNSAPEELEDLLRLLKKLTRNRVLKRLLK